MKVDLSAAELSHLLNLLSDQKDRGEYYGPREQYFKRNQRLMEKLTPRFESKPAPEPKP